MTTPEPVTPAQLAELAQRLSLSTQSMADYLGVPVHTLIKWQNGTRTPPAVASRLLAVLAIVETLAPELHRAALLPPPPLPKITREAVALQQLRNAPTVPPAPRRRRAADPAPEALG